MLFQLVAGTIVSLISFCIHGLFTVLIVAVTWAALREKALLKPTPIED